MKLAKIVISTALILLLGTWVNSQTMGPGGESSTPSSQIVVGDGLVDSIKAGNYTAALLWHD